MRKDSELVLAPDGSLYHIHLNYDTLADNVILVGDPSRVDMFRSIFDSVEHESYNREIHAITGTYRDTRFTAISTGMGCDNIDIVMTELDAAANIDLATGDRRPSHRALRLVRIGTCGGLQPDLPAGTIVASCYAVGLDGLLHYYQHDPALLQPSLSWAFIDHMRLPDGVARPYAAAGSTDLLDRIARTHYRGITATAPGFYGPQGRNVSVAPSVSDLTARLADFEWQGLRIANLEMETSAIYGLSALMNHQALTVCLVIANRIAGSFLNDYHAPMRDLIAQTMQSLAE